MTQEEMQQLLAASTLKPTTSPEQQARARQQAAAQLARANANAARRDAIRMPTMKPPEPRAAGAPVAGGLPVTAMLMDFLSPNQNALDDLVLGTPEKKQPSPGPSRKAQTPPKAKRNPEQDILDNLLAAGGEWSLNQLGAIAGMREAPGRAPPMKDVIMASGDDLSKYKFDLNWERAMTETDPDKRFQKQMEALETRSADVAQMLGTGIGIPPGFDFDAE